MDGDLSLKYRCEKCGYSESVSIGTGWNGPFVKDVIEDILKGKFGEKWKELFQNTPGAEVDERMELYVCPACKSYKNEINLSIYRPKKPEEIPAEAKMPYLQIISRHKHTNRLLSLRRARHYLEFWQQPYVHVCTKCGRRMHLYKDGELMRCPKCADGWMTEEERSIV